jgi:hypothetical protein
MLAWNDAWFYIAIEARDDATVGGEVAPPLDARGAGCTAYRTGLQLGFEVGGPAAPVPGLVQAARSADLAVSRMLHVGLGLRPGQESCDSARALDAGDNRTTCCVNHAAEGRLSRTQTAVLRNPNNRRTYIEVAIAMRDLLPASALTAVHRGESAGAVQSAAWAEGLRFGFAFALNDGDDADASEGWLGYYPRAIKVGARGGAAGETPGHWNGGQREPSKCGVVRLGGAYRPSARRGGGGGFWVGVLTTLAVQLLGLWLLRARRRGEFPFTLRPLRRFARRPVVLSAPGLGGATATRSITVPLASSDGCAASAVSDGVAAQQLAGAASGAL